MAALPVAGMLLPPVLRLGPDACMTFVSSVTPSTEGYACAEEGSLGRRVCAAGAPADVAVAAAAVVVGAGECNVTDSVAEGGSAGAGEGSASC